MSSVSRTVIHVVPHVHWDPEWYSSYQEYRIRLVKLVDKLLDILETSKAYRYFMFDGQVSAIADYLDVKPENESRIREQVQQGRLLLGPWWILPEEFMLSPENHIRNLLVGREAGARFGGTMHVSYLCDMPGHVGQLPQILRGFGIGCMAAWRGVAGYPETNRDLFRWKAPDGSEVLVIHMVNGYGNAWRLTREDDPIACAAQIMARYQPFATTDQQLWMHGADHVEPSAKLPDVVARLNRAFPGKRFEFSTLSRFAEFARRKRVRLKTHRGEMRAALRSAVFASGNLATRMGIKIANRASETLLEQWAESFGAMAWTLGGADPRPFLRRAWRYLLQNSFHDVIYGGHADHVTPDAMGRYKACGEIAHWVTQEALHDIARKIDTQRAGESVVAFNPLAMDRSMVVDGEIRDEAFDDPGKQGRKPTLIDENGALVPFQLHESRKEPCLVTRKGVIEYSKSAPCIRYAFSFLADEVPALGWKTWSLAFLPPAEIRERMPQTDLILCRNGCENTHLELRIHANGTFSVTHKATRETYRNLNLFEDTGDVGDHYFYHPPQENRTFTTRNAKAQIELIRRGPVEVQYRIRIPFKISAQATRKGRSRTTVVCPIDTFVSLQAGSRFVEVRTEVQNRARDHRLRVLFPTGIRTETVHADGAFEVVARPVRCAKQPEWKEQPEGYFPQRLFVSMHKERRGLTVINKGLPQYQADRRGTLCVTLLRCVSHLLKLELPGWGAPEYSARKWPTPDAQEIGPHEFCYAVYPHKGAWLSANAHREAMAFHADTRMMHTDAHAGELPLSGSFFRLSPESLILSSVKPSEDGTGVILRAYNASGRTIQGRIEAGLPCRRVAAVDMNEEPATNLHIRCSRNNRVSFPVKAHRIVTLKFLLAGNCA